MPQLSFKINYNGDLCKITSAPELLLDDIAQQFGFDHTQVVTFKVQDDEIDINDVIARAHAMPSGKSLAVSIDVIDPSVEPAVQSCDDTESLKQKAAESKARALATKEEAHKMMLVAKQHARIAKDAEKAARVAEKEEAKAARIAQKEAAKAETQRAKEHAQMKIEAHAFQPQSNTMRVPSAPAPPTYAAPPSYGETTGQLSISAAEFVPFVPPSRDVSLQEAGASPQGENSSQQEADFGDKAGKGGKFGGRGKGGNRRGHGGYTSDSGSDDSDSDGADCFWKCGKGKGKGKGWKGKKRSSDDSDSDGSDAGKCFGECGKGKGYKGKGKGCKGKKRSSDDSDSDGSDAGKCFGECGKGKGYKGKGKGCKGKKGSSDNSDSSDSDGSDAGEGFWKCGKGKGYKGKGYKGKGWKGKKGSSDSSDSDGSDAGDCSWKCGKGKGYKGKGKGYKGKGKGYKGKTGQWECSDAGDWQQYYESIRQKSGFVWQHRRVVRLSEAGGDTVSEDQVEGAIKKSVANDTEARAWLLSLKAKAAEADAAMVVDAAGAPVARGRADLHAAALRGFAGDKCVDHIFCHPRRAGVVVVDLHQVVHEEATVLLQHLISYRVASLHRADEPWKLVISVGAGKHSSKELPGMVQLVAETFDLETLQRVGSVPYEGSLHTQLVMPGGRSWAKETSFDCRDGKVKTWRHRKVRDQRADGDAWDDQMGGKYTNQSEVSNKQHGKGGDKRWGKRWGRKCGDVENGCSKEDAK